jgi:hypothetical protein
MTEAVVVLELLSLMSRWCYVLEDGRQASRRRVQQMGKPLGAVRVQVRVKETWKWVGDEKWRKLKMS